MRSLPSRKCGLKLVLFIALHGAVAVTSLAEVWIEIWNSCVNNIPAMSHFPRGSVD